MLNTKLLGGTASAQPVYSEDVFQTWLYTGTGSAITVNNGVDLSSKGGLVWFKTRTGTITGDHYLIDTVRGNNKLLVTTVTDAQDTDGTLLTAFNNNGFSVGTNGVVNTNTRTYASWTFREAPKFFDIVTFTATGSSQVVSHNLGSTPGMIIFKRTDGASNWLVWHRSYPAQYYQTLNLNNASADLGAVWCTPTSTDVTINTVFGAGQTWVAYFYAHNAGGFGTAGTDNVISCGSFTANGSGGYSVNLGYEAQYVLLKRTSGTGNWFILDVMRGAGVGSATTQELKANLVAAESTNSGNLMSPSATGFGADTALSNLDAGDYIYMAIRRPMKPPTSGTQVFDVKTEGVNANVFSTLDAPDLVIAKAKNGNSGSASIHQGQFVDRLRGLTQIASNTIGAVATNTPVLLPTETNAEATSLSAVGLGRAGTSDSQMRAMIIGRNGSDSNVLYAFRRASGFFDEVCYTGTGSNTTQAHNLGAVPELMIVKRRNTSGTNWLVYATGLGATKCTTLNTTDSQFTSASFWNDTAPTSSVFTVGTSVSVNNSADTYVAYLFATLAGVSKVGSYTGNGSSQTINCGFTAGARFVMVRRVDAVGNWVVWDTARGIVSGNDPYLLLNSTAAEVTTTDAIDPDNSGFIINRLAAIDVNENGGSYIFMAIA